MTIRHKMLRWAKGAQNLLPPKAIQQIIQRTLQTLHSDGGFCGRGTSSDLYYTVFAMKTLLALEADFPVNKMDEYLQSFGSGEHLDLVHLSCLIRSWANLPGKEPSTHLQEKMLQQVLHCRVGKSGFANSPSAQRESVYSTFLALGALQDLGQKLTDQEELVSWLFSSSAAEEGFVFDPNASSGLTPVTAAAMVLLKHCNQTVPPATIQWLFKRHSSQGGFYAAPSLPFP